MVKDTLTIVVPTRDRPELLARCLRSIFEQQPYRPEVIVSDNSTNDHAAVHGLRSRYDFAYIRQSGKIPVVGHQNLCLRMPTSQWVLLLHDDDELCPGSLGAVGECLANGPEVGIVMAGTQAIDLEGRVTGEWVPTQRATLRGDEALLALGLDWGLRAPGTIYSVSENRRLGGLPDVLGLPADYAHALALAYSAGISFLPVCVGRQREWPQRASVFDTPARALRWLSFTCQQAALVRNLGGSPEVADRLVDYLAWSTFEGLEPWWRTFDRPDVIELVETCLTYSSKRGAIHDRVRRSYPFLFWRPRWVSEPALAVARLALRRLPRPVRRTVITVAARILHQR